MRPRARDRPRERQDAVRSEVRLLPHAQRANAQGAQGPNLDEAFRIALRDGMTESTVAGVVHRQIANVRRGSIMPRQPRQGQRRPRRGRLRGRRRGQARPGHRALATAGLAEAPRPESQIVPRTAAPPPRLERRPQRRARRSRAQRPGPAAATARAGYGEQGQQYEHNIAIRCGRGERDRVAIVGQGGVDARRPQAASYTVNCSVPALTEDGGIEGHAGGQEVATRSSRSPISAGPAATSAGQAALRAPRTRAARLGHEQPRRRPVPVLDAALAEAVEAARGEPRQIQGGGARAADVAHARAARREATSACSTRCCCS